MNWHPGEVPLRSLLFVPGNNPKMIRKAWTTGTDAVIIDFEDGVPPASRRVARVQVQHELAEAPSSKPRILVRISAFTSREWQEDLEATVGSGIEGVVLPKCEAPSAIRSVDRFLGRREKASRVGPGTVRLFLLIESAKGLLNIGPMLASSRRVIGLMLGGEDFCLDMGVTRTLGGTELFYPRAALAVCARAHRCYAIDTIYDNLKDAEGLVHETRLVKALGFSGKLAIHPNQIKPILSVFAPSAREVAEANRIVAAFDQAQAAGSAVIILDGKMVDRPIAERARRVVALASEGGRENFASPVCADSI